MAEAPFILPLDHAADSALAGGKASKLAQLLAAGFDVPAGFVLTTTFHHAWQISSDSSALQQELFAAFTKLINNEADVLVAVRSSATAEDLDAASMAGQYETILNVGSSEALWAAVQKCFASLDSPRTRAYLAQHGLNISDIGMALIVQRQVQAHVAGVLFTADPNTANQDRFMLEATWGLGETLVSGIGQPDIFHLDAATGALLDQTIATKELMLVPGSARHGPTPVPVELRNIPCVTADQLRSLHDLARRIAGHFPAPQDVEWAFEEDSAGRFQLRVLQSRPITTLPHAQAYHGLVQATQKCLNTFFKETPPRGPLVLHNLAETLPHPTPLTWSIIRPFMTGSGGFGAMYRMAGFEPSELACREGFLELLAGNIYMDASRAAEMFFTEFPYRYDPEQLRTNPDAAQAPPTLPAGSLRRRMRVGRRIKQSERVLAGLAPTFDQTLNTSTIPAFLSWCEAEETRGLTTMAATELAASWEARRARVLDDFAPHSLLPSLIAGQAMAALQQFLAEEFWQKDDMPAVEAAQLLASPLQPDQTLASNIALYQLAHTQPANLGESLAAWMRDFGHRGPEEFDLAAPRWRERPDALRKMALQLANAPDPEQRHHARATEAETLRVRLAARLSPGRQREFEDLLSLARRYMIFRENGKHYLMRGYALLRGLTQEIGRRLKINNDIMLLTAEEMLMALGNGSVTPELQSAIAQRKLQRHAENRLNLPNYLDASFTLTEKTSQSSTPSEFTTLNSELPAHCLSTGIASGPVRIVLSPEDAAERELGQNYVLVCPSTDPNWTPLFMNAVALILERGGSLSHGAVVAREMGIPAVVLANATTLLQEGAVVTVNAHQNVVHRSDGAGAERIHNSEFKIQNTAVPPAGRWERSTTRLSALFGAVWLLFLAGVFLLPASLLHDPSMELLDAILWPVVRAIGRPATTAFLALAMAVGTMLLQRFLTDTLRLRVARQRATVPGKGITPDVQTRLLLVAIFPIALLLGPMIMIFLWLPTRMDPATFAPPPPPPAAMATIIATLRADYSGPVELTASPEIVIEGPTQKALPNIRPVLENLLSQMKADPATPAEKMMGLRAYLADMPPQTLQWKIHGPAEGTGRWPVTVTASSAKGDVVLTVGENDPPGPLFKSEFRTQNSELVSLELRPIASHPRPFLQLPGMSWDPGWLLVYLAAYLPGMFLSKRLLRVP